MRDNKPILLVEDDDIDAEAVELALQQLHVTNPLVRVTDGELALARLRDPSQRTPGLILLDLNLPVMNGIEFLQMAKGDEQLRSLPVVVLTTSRLTQDKLATFQLSVAGYMVKPVDSAQFIELIHAINLYWTFSETPP
ncbi:MAG TPA: response regulator [Clostridia bacterium]|nr:response regulator [Clostridia bacterium]